VFIDLPGGERGFLRQPKGLAPGQRVLVQVSGVTEPGKALPLSLRLMFKSRYAIVTPGAPGLNISRSLRDEDLRAELTALATQAMAGAGADLGLILRSACADAEPDEIAADVTQMRDLAQAVLADITGPPELLVDAPGPHELAWRDWGTRAGGSGCEHRRRYLPRCRAESLHRRCPRTAAPAAASWPWRAGGD